MVDGRKAWKKESKRRKIELYWEISNKLNCKWERAFSSDRIDVEIANDPANAENGENEQNQNEDENQMRFCSKCGRRFQTHTAMLQHFSHCNAGWRSW